jgi:hypothetical protein
VHSGPFVTLSAPTTAHCDSWEISGKWRLAPLRVCDRPGVEPGLSCGVVVEPRRNRTGDPSLPWTHQEPLCGRSFSQITSGGRGQSYRFSSTELCVLFSCHAPTFLEQAIFCRGHRSDDQAAPGFEVLSALGDEAPRIWSCRLVGRPTCRAAREPPPPGTRCCERSRSSSPDRA